MKRKFEQRIYNENIKYQAIIKLFFSDRLLTWRNCSTTMENVDLDKGHIMHPDSFTDIFNKFMRKHNLPDIRLHDLDIRQQLF